MNARIKTASLDTVEDVMDAVDIWLHGESTREFKVRRTILGSVATLYQCGNAVGCGRGQGAADAIANALTEYWKKVRGGLR